MAAAPLTSSEQDVLAGLACEYLGPHTDDGQYMAEASLKRDTLINFQWRAQVGGDVITRIVTTRCHHAVKGILFPHAWKTALGCLHVYSLADKSAEGATLQNGTPARCQFVGQPRPRGTIADDGSRAPGAVIETGSIACLLCAHVRESMWLVHKGNLTDDALPDTSNPFHEKDLVLQDMLQTDALLPSRYGVEELRALRNKKKGAMSNCSLQSRNGKRKQAMPSRMAAL